MAFWPNSQQNSQTLKKEGQKRVEQLTRKKTRIKKQLNLKTQSIDPPTRNIVTTIRSSTTIIFVRRVRCTEPPRCNMLRHRTCQTKVRPKAPKKRAQRHPKEAREGSKIKERAYFDVGCFRAPEKQPTGPQRESGGGTQSCAVVSILLRAPGPALCSSVDSTSGARPSRNQSIGGQGPRVDHAKELTRGQEF